MIVAALVIPFVLGIALMLGRAVIAPRAAAMLGAIASAASFVLFLIAWCQESGTVDVSWIEPLGARLHLGLTVYSIPFILMTTFLAVLCCVWLLGERDSSPAFVGLVLVIVASSLGVFCSLDLVLFFVFFELALIPMWFVIAWWGDPHDPVGRRLAATRFLLFTVAGSALLLVGIVVVALRAETLQIFDVGPGSGLTLAAALIAAGLAVKTPVVPLHTWLPDAHGKAPTVGSVLLAGVFLKLGTYGLIVLGSVMLTDGFDAVAPWLAVAGVAGIIWSALACYAQDDLKRLIAYSSVGHMGFVVLAISTMSDVGLVAAVFGSVAHGVITAMLFFVAGSLKDRFGTASLRAIGRGLYGRTPWLAVTFVFAAVASLGLPGLAGFWGELLALRSAYEVGDVLDKPLAWSALGVALLGVALTSAYVIRAIRLLAQGEPIERAEDRDLDVRETVVLGALTIVILALGLAPTAITHLYDGDETYVDVQVVEAR